MVGTVCQEQRPDDGREDFFDRQRRTHRQRGQPRVPGEELVPAFVRDDCLEREVVRVGIAVERPSFHDEQVRSGVPGCTDVSRAPRLAVRMTILGSADEPDR